MTEQLVPNRFAADTIGDLKLRCPPGNAAGQAVPLCAWTGPVSDLAAHQSTCTAEQVPCRWSGCCEVTARGVAATHAVACTHRERFCVDCQEVLLGADAIAPHGASCGGVPMPCPNTGCSASARRGEMEFHRATCAFEIVTCAVPGCGARVARNGMEAHFAAASGAHTAALVGLIQTLNGSLLALSGHVQALTARLDLAERRSVAAAAADDDDDAAPAAKRSRR